MMVEQAQVNWENTIVTPDATLREVIATLEKGGVQIALVCDKTRKLLGTVTDGDVRRALLRGYDLNSRSEEIMFTTPMAVSEDIGRSMVLNLMRVNKIHQLPVIDEQNKIVGLHVWDEIIAPTEYDNTVVIMAGGFGKRLRPYTENCPKPMLEVSGKPILEHIIERAVADGFQNFVISLYYLPEVITNYFGDGSKWNIKISYVRETSPLGTAGALTLLNPKPTLPFIVTNGDVLTKIRYSEMLEFHESHQAAATMAVRQHQWQHPFGVVHTQGIKITGFEEKPIHRSHVNAGIYVLNPMVLSTLSEGKVCDMPTVFERLQASDQSTIAYPMHEIWMDVGRPEDLIEANKDIND